MQNPFETHLLQVLLPSPRTDLFRPAYCDVISQRHTFLVPRPVYSRLGRVEDFYISLCHCQGVIKFHCSLHNTYSAIYWWRWNLADAPLVGLSIIWFLFPVLASQTCLSRVT